MTVIVSSPNILADMQLALDIYNKCYKSTLNIIEQIKKFTEDVAVDLIYNAQTE